MLFYNKRTFEKYKYHINKAHVYSIKNTFYFYNNVALLIENCHYWYQFTLLQWVWKASVGRMRYLWHTQCGNAENTALAWEQNPCKMEVLEVA